MSEGYKIVRKAMDELMSSDETKRRLLLPVSQISKFEHWLKIELGYRIACGLDASEKPSVKFEPKYEENDRQDRADISFIRNNSTYLIEIKTPRSRKIGDNQSKISKGLQGDLQKRKKGKESGIIPDIRKLQGNPFHGIVVFVIFPLHEEIRNEERKK